MSPEELVAIKVYNDAYIEGMREGAGTQHALDLADLEIRRAYYPRERIEDVDSRSHYEELARSFHRDLSAEPAS